MKTLVFDLGGVIVSTAEEPVMKWISENYDGYDFKKLMHIRHKPWVKFCLGQITEDDYIHEFLEATGLKISSKILKKKFREVLTASIPGIIELLKELKCKGFKLVVLSNMSKEWGEYIISMHNLEEIFDEIFLTCNIGVKKPSTEIYELTLLKLGAKPEDCIFIDDSQKNIIPAESLGIESILFKSANQLRRELNIIK